MIVQGKVKDEFGEDIISASVVLLDSNGNTTTTGVSTDLYGRFYLDSNLITSNSMLQISFITHHTRKIKVSELQAMNNIVVLYENANMLDELEITAENKKSGFNWWWLLLAIPVGYGIHKATEKKPKKVTI